MIEILKQLNIDLFVKKNQIFDWLESQFADFNLIYSSQDIRNSGYKISAVDVNYFPAGFNNLSNASIEICTQSIKKFLSNRYNFVDKIVIVAENFSRNFHYLDNIAALKKIFTQVGLQVEIATLITDGEDSNFVNLEQLLPRINKKSTIFLLNNDLSLQVPDYLKEDSLNIMPPIVAGWHQRSKAEYFQHYNKVVKQFSKEFNFHPFLLSTEIDFLEKVDFKARVGIENLAEKVDAMLQKIATSYRERQISTKPYVVIKSDRGTFGMAVMKASAAEDVLSMNKKQRNKMSVGKGGVSTEKIFIQEGIATIEKHNDHIAESMVYSVCNKPVSLISRYHQEKNELSILNAVGMEFKEKSLLTQDNPDLFLHYIISMLSQIAAKEDIYALTNSSKNISS